VTVGGTNVWVNVAVLVTVGVDVTVAVEVRVNVDVTVLVWVGVKVGVGGMAVEVWVGVGLEPFPGGITRSSISLGWRFTEKLEPVVWDVPGMEARLEGDGFTLPLI
jgi:hypothetical protein